MPVTPFKICVFCSSSEALHKKYYEIAGELGRLIGKNNYTLVHGGGKIGLMGVMARSVQAQGASVIGVIPEKLNIKGVASETDDQMIVTKDMSERKAVMHDLADAFITLPGGFGTMEEILETLTLKQLKYHSKPVVFINTGNFYAKLFEQFERLYAESFAKPDYRKLYSIVENPEEALNYIKDYKYENIQDTWF